MSEFLKIFQMEGKSLSWWNTRRKMINLDPSYQRKGRRWSISDKAYLIDSMINGYDLPKFYLVDFTFGGGNIKSEGFHYAVIDGKQRFEAIFDFIDNKFPLSKNFVSREAPDIDVSGLTYSELEEKAPFLKESFDNYNITVMGVISGNESLINEIFIRLNRGRPLNGAELRNAISGPSGAMTRDLAKHPFFTDNIRFSVSKSQDLNLINKLLKFEVEGGPSDTKKKSLDIFSEKTPHNEIERAFYKVSLNLDDMAEIFLPRDPLLKSEGPIPVYYWCFQSLDENNRTYFRDFLSDFISALEKIEHPFFPVHEMLEYKKHSRSINDRNSNVKRADIISRMFREWLNHHFVSLL